MDKEYGSHVDFMQAVDELTRDRFDVVQRNCDHNSLMEFSSPRRRKGQ